MDHLRLRHCGRVPGDSYTLWKKEVAEKNEKQKNATTLLRMITDNFRRRLSFCLSVCLSVCLSLSLSLSLSLPQLFVFLFDVLNVAVFVIRDRFVKKPTSA